MSADALYQAILANPDDDLPRLVYADWLEENGKPDTAAFIRVQCELARLPKWDPLWVRCRYLDPSWLTGVGRQPPKLTAAAGWSWADDRYRRGWPCRARLSNFGRGVGGLAKWLRRAPVDGLILTGLPGDEYLSGLTGVPEFSRIRSVEFRGTQLNRTGLKPLLESPHALGVRELRFRSNVVDAAGLRSLLQSPLAAGIRHLRLHLNFILSRGSPLRSAFQGVTLPALAHLDLTEGVPGVTLRDLLRSVHLPQLRRLDLANCELGDAGVRGLLSWAGCSQLDTLNLTRTRMGRSAVKPLANAGWQNLKLLNLSDCEIGPQGAKMLARAGGLAELRGLSLSNIGVGDTGVKALASSPGVRNLLVLDLWQNGITDTGARAMLESPHLDNLIFLNVEANEISADLLDQLRQRFALAVTKYHPSYIKMKR